MGELDIAAPGRGSAVTQSLYALKVEEAHSAFGATGAGIRIGIISDSFDAAPRSRDGGGYAADVVSGDLPGDVTILSDLNEAEALSTGAKDEGRAMAQLVHDLAPDAEIYFASGYGSKQTFAQAINRLVGTGVDIIVDDLYYEEEPYFSDGMIAQAAGRAVSKGVAYFAAAGNDGAAGLTGALDFSGRSGVAGTIHDWKAGAGFDGDLDISVKANATIDIVLTWSDTFRSEFAGSSGATSDLDIVLTVEDQPITLGWYREVMGEAAFERSRAELERQFVPLGGKVDLDTPLGGINGNLSEDAIETVRFFNPYGDRDIEIGVQIEYAAGTSEPAAFQLRFPGSSTLTEFVDDPGPNTKIATVYGHVAAKGVIGVGAAGSRNTPAQGAERPVLETFSARGDVEITHWPDGTPRGRADLRTGVDIVAADGGNTTFFGKHYWWDRDAHPNFVGTSARCRECRGHCGPDAGSRSGPDSGQASSRDAGGRDGHG